MHLKLINIIQFFYLNEIQFYQNIYEKINDLSNTHIGEISYDEYKN